MERITVGIADDQEITLEMLVNIVTSQDKLRLVGTASDGYEALDLLRDKKPQVLLLDLIMPQLDGYEVLRRMHSDDLIAPDTKVIVITAAFNEDMVEDVFALGASYFIRKPFDAESIIQSICSAASAKPMFPLEEQLLNEDKAHLPLEHRITELMLLLGVPAHLRGYQYLRDAIAMAVRQPDTLGSKARTIYEAIADKNQTTVSSVERSIRHAIEIAWTRGDLDTIDEVFGYTIRASRGRPTNSEFIAIVADRIMLESKR